MTAAPTTEDRLGDFTTDTRVSRESGWLTSPIRLFRNKVRMRFRRAG